MFTRGIELADEARTNEFATRANRRPAPVCCEIDSSAHGVSQLHPRPPRAAPQRLRDCRDDIVPTQLNLDDGDDNAHDTPGKRDTHLGDARGGILPTSRLALTAAHRARQQLAPHADSSCPSASLGQSGDEHARTLPPTGTCGRRHSNINQHGGRRRISALAEAGRRAWPICLSLSSTLHASMSQTEARASRGAQSATRHWLRVGARLSRQLPDVA